MKANNRSSASSMLSATARHLRRHFRRKALSTATYLEIDDVIDPAESRDRIAAALRASRPPAPRTGKKRPNIDVW